MNGHWFRKTVKSHYYTISVEKVRGALAFAAAILRKDLRLEKVNKQQQKIKPLSAN